jgi:cytochrome c
MRKTLLSLFVVGVAAVPAAAQAPDGQQAFNNSCRTCHTVKEGDNRQGPSLFGIVGRKAGTGSGYAFSPSMAQSGITWDEASLDKFIENPDAVVSGNAMKPYGGVRDPAQRKLIIDYLKTAK